MNCNIIPALSMDKRSVQHLTIRADVCNTRLPMTWQHAAATCWLSEPIRLSTRQPIPVTGKIKFTLPESTG